MNVITFFQQQHVLVGGCLCTIKGIIFANQIDVSVTVDIDVFDIRNGKIGFGICNSWFRDVATACDVVRSVVISTGTVVRLIVVLSVLPLSMPRSCLYLFRHSVWEEAVVTILYCSTLTAA